MSKTGFLFDKRYLDHDTGSRHPESSQRLAATMDHLKRQPWFANLVHLQPNQAEREWIESVHQSDYIDRAWKQCGAGSRILDDPDVTICESSFDVAVLATGGALTIADAVMRGNISNGFALVRPPGHHAEFSRAMGFCLFNSIAITARYLQKCYGIEKVAILDWDVHHGNGTQHSFEQDPSVLFISLHQYPYYPGSGSYSETGTGAGANATVNCPMAAGSSDTDYEKAFVERVLPAINAFEPQAVLLSAGFDAHFADPLAQINLSTEFYGWMTQTMLEVAERYAQGRLISLLEGGYSLDYLPLCVATHLRKLMTANDSTPIQTG